MRADDASPENRNGRCTSADEIDVDVDVLAGSVVVRWDSNVPWKAIFKQEMRVLLSLGFVDTLVEKEVSTSRRSGPKVGEISAIPCAWCFVLDDQGSSTCAGKFEYSRVQSGIG